MGAAVIVGESGVSNLGTAVTDVVSYMGTALNFVTDNPVLMLFLAGGIVSMGFGLFRKAKRSVK